MLILAANLARGVEAIEGKKTKFTWQVINRRASGQGKLHPTVRMTSDLIKFSWEETFFYSSVTHFKIENKKNKKLFKTFKIDSLDLSKCNTQIENSICTRPTAYEALNKPLNKYRKDKRAITLLAPKRRNLPFQPEPPPQSLLC